MQIDILHTRGQANYADGKSDKLMQAKLEHACL